MASEDMPTTIVNETNALKLDFPRDPHGFTTLLRKEGVRAVGRLAASDDKLAIFLNTLKVLARYAKAKIETQKLIRADDVIAAEMASEAERVRKEEDQSQELMRLTHRMEALQAQIALNSTSTANPAVEPPVAE